MDEEPEAVAEPACVWLISPRGTRADGSTTAITDPRDDRVGTACLCITEDEYRELGERLSRVGPPESGTLLEEFNEIAYDECTRLSALDEDDFIADECLDYYQEGRWLKDIYFTRGAWTDGLPPDFSCAQ